MDKEEYIFQIAELLYERTSITKGDADDLAYDILDLIRE